jgi:uncharacterized RDD family membrane protein YckC
MSVDQPQLPVATPVGADQLAPAAAAARARGAIRQVQIGPVYATYAGFVSRVMAMVVDLLIMAAFLGVAGIVSNFFAHTSGLTQILNLLDDYLPWITPLRSFLLTTAFGIIVVLTSLFVYFTFFYSFGGATLGKYLMGLRVVRTDGRRLQPRQAALRALAYAPSSLALYLGFLAVLVDDRRRGWHDRIAGTVVIYKWQARPDEEFFRDLADELN